MRSRNSVPRNSHPFATSPIASPKAVVAGDKYRFTLLCDGVLRYEYAADGVFEDRASTFAINRNLPIPEFQVINRKQSLEIITDRFHLTYDRKIFSPNGLTIQVRGNVTAYDSIWRYGEPGDSSLGGTARTLDLADGPIPLEPGVISQRGFACIDDSDSMLFDDNGWVGGRRDGDRADGYVFACGLDYKAAIRAFYAISGSQPQLPRWALGNWWSRYHPYSASEYLALMDRFQDEDIPFSVAVIDMDWHLVDDPRVTHSGWTGYTWNKTLIPDPKAFLADLHKRGLKVTLNDHAADGVHPFEDLYPQMCKALGLDPSRKEPILFNCTDRKFFEAYFDPLHRSLEDDGVDFWWIDWQSGRFSKIPNVDPLWMLNHFHFLDNQHRNKQPLIFSRYAGPGSHRYPVGFSGDSVISWKSLDFQPEFTSTASNIGYGWWSHDIGGHMKGYRDSELATRWVQLGVFSPLMRLHSTLSEWNSKEPWQFTAESRKIMTKMLQLRHKLIPYLYTMNIRAAREDEPLIQPIYWEYPLRNEAYAHKNQFFFGSQLMVAPITSPRDKSTYLAKTKAWFPPGRFVDIFAGTVYDGNREIYLHRQLDEYPVLAHEGTILPLDASAVIANGGANPDTFEILIVVGKDGRYEIIEDADSDQDGDWVLASSAADYESKTVIEYNQEKGEVTITPPSGSPDLSVRKRDWKLRFLSFTSSQDVKVLIDEHEIKSISTLVEDHPSQSPGLVVDLGSVPYDAQISISLCKNPKLDVVDHGPRIHMLIHNYEIEYEMKDAMWDIVNEENVPASLKTSRIMALGYDEDVVGPVVELLLADAR